MTLSASTQDLLKAYAGRGFSNDPTLLARHKVRLLQNTSKLPRHGQGAPGLWLLPDEASSCTSKMRCVAGAIYSMFVEKSPDDKWVGEYYILPPEAEKVGYNWKLPGGNTVEKEARIAGVFNRSIDGELDLSRTAMKTAKAFNSDAMARAKKLNAPLFALSFEFGSQPLVNDRGQPYHGPTYEYLGTIGDPEGPTEEEVLRAAALYDLITATVEAATREAEDRKTTVLSFPRQTEITPGRMLITPQKPAPAKALIDDDIPFMCEWR